MSTTGINFVYTMQISLFQDAKQYHLGHKARGKDKNEFQQYQINSGSTYIINSNNTYKINSGSTYIINSCTRHITNSNSAHKINSGCTTCSYLQYIH